MYKKRFEDGGEIGDYVGQSGYENPEVGSSLFAGLDLNALGIDPNLFAEGLDLNALLPDIIGDADVMNALKAQDPAAYAALLSAGEGYGFAPIGSDNVTGQELVGPNPADSGDTSVNAAETKKLGRQAGTDPEQDPSLKATGVPVGDPNDPMGTKKLASISGDKTTSTTADKKGILGTDITATDAAKYAAMLAMAKLAYDDAQRAREEARGWSAPGGVSKQAVRSPGGGVSFKKAASGGIMSLQGGGALRDEMINTRIRQLNPTTGPQGAGADYVNFVKNKAEQDVSKFESDLKTLGLTDPEALETYASNFRYGPIYEGYEESGLDFSPRLNARTDETANVIRALATPSTQARSDYEANISELASEPTYDIGIPQLYESNMSSVMLSPEYDFSGEMSNKDLATAAMPTGYLTQEDEEELGSGYSGLMALLAPKMGEDVTQMRAAGGGIGSLGMAQGGRALPPRYLDGHSDGMADKVPANIDGKRPAALSDGEFVIPADVVSHLGNGNSNAGAKRLYKMMDDIRAARTGNPKQGKQINPDKFMPR